MLHRVLGTAHFTRNKGVEISRANLHHAQLCPHTVLKHLVVVHGIHLQVHLVVVHCIHLQVHLVVVHCIHLQVHGYLVTDGC